MSQPTGNITGRLGVAVIFTNNDEKKQLLRHFIDKVVVNKKQKKVTYNFYKIPHFDLKFMPCVHNGTASEI